MEYSPCEAVLSHIEAVWVRANNLFFGLIRAKESLQKPYSATSILFVHDQKTEEMPFFHCFCILSFSIQQKKNNYRIESNLR